MRTWARFAAPALVLVSFGTARAADDGTFHIRDAMRGPVNEATLEIWDVGNYAMDDEGGLNAAKLDDELWARLETASVLLEQRAAHLAAAPTLKSARPDDMESEEGSYSMEDVQTYIDADPQTFRLLARALSEHAAKISAAAKARDARQAGLLVGEIDQVCESCHMKYWYPES